MKLLAPATPSTASVCMLIMPTVRSSVTLPERRAPAWIGICVPASLIPIRRLKNSSVWPSWRPLADWLFTVKMPAFSRKNGRFSGKNRLKRSRLICWSSTSTCAKSVLNVPSRVRPELMLYFRSAPYA